MLFVSDNIKNVRFMGEFVKKIFFIVLAVLFVAGCKGDNFIESGEGENCLNTSDCKDNLKCINFTCVDSNDSETSLSDEDAENEDLSDEDTDEQEEDVPESDSENSDTDTSCPDNDFGRDTDDIDTEKDDYDFECSPGEVRTLACTQDSLQLQKQICSEIGIWQNAGACYTMPDTPDMVEIPGGPFSMGCNNLIFNICNEDEYPYHKVDLRAYRMDKYEVTVFDYQICMQNGACNNKNEEKPHYDNYSDDNPYCNIGNKDKNFHPANCISWYGAKAYCEWIGRRLPTEAEWEKAARGTDGRIYPWGNNEVTCDYAVIGDANCGTAGTMEVESKPSGVSLYELYNMSGNVEEWVSDWYDGDYYSISPKDDPEGPETGSHHVIRGGSWNYSTVHAFFVFSRHWHSPEERSFGFGFRCAE